MVFKHASRVKETSTTTGTGTYNLAGAPTGFQSFVAGIGSGNLCYYEADDGTSWETGIGTVTSGSPDTLARTQILESSNANAAVNWGAGTKTLFVTEPGATYPEFVGDITPPVNPSPGMRFFDWFTGIEFTWLSDGNAFNWVEAGPQGIPDMADLFKILASDDAGGTNVNTAQPWFPTAGGVTIVANTTYRFIGMLYATRAAGVTSHTTGIGFGGTATVASMATFALTNSGVDVITDSAAHFTAFTGATSTTVKSASTSATEILLVKVLGIVRFTTAGTFIPQFTYSAAPGGAPTIKANSYFYLSPIGDNNKVSTGLWA